MRKLNLLPSLSSVQCIPVGSGSAFGCWRRTVSTPWTRVGDAVNLSNVTRALGRLGTITRRRASRRTCTQVKYREIGAREESDHDEHKKGI